MNNHLAVLDTMPTAAEFYGRYWNKHPFVVRGHISADTLTSLISADELAGLSMEEDARSRLVKTAGDHAAWSCRFGPFSGDDFSDAGDHNWSLLVQNVEQFHPETSALLPHFNFAPRWMMDDIMVSFSAPGGSVGPHFDSYHVFLVQGQGRRRWKVSHARIQNATYVDNPDLKILATGFGGDEIEVMPGDVLYVPPAFAHEGTTLEPALTFSIGFLGPKTSDLFASYGHYLSERENLDQRYSGDGLVPDCAGHFISTAAAGAVRDRFYDVLKSEDFTRWLVTYFTEQSNEDLWPGVERDEPLSTEQFHKALDSGVSLIKPNPIKFAITASVSGNFCLGVDGQNYDLAENLFPVIKKLMANQTLTSETTPEITRDPICLDLLRQLYNHQALDFAPLANNF